LGRSLFSGKSLVSPKRAISMGGGEKKKGESSFFSAIGKNKLTLMGKRGPPIHFTRSIGETVPAWENLGSEGERREEGKGSLPRKEHGSGKNSRFFLPYGRRRKYYPVCCMTSLEWREGKGGDWRSPDRVTCDPYVDRRKRGRSVHVLAKPKKECELPTKLLHLSPRRKGDGARWF